MGGKRNSLRVPAIALIAICMLLLLTACNTSIGRTRWEYKVEYLDTNLRTSEDAANLWESRLNVLGEEGWECDLQVYGFTIVCKRPK